MKSLDMCFCSSYENCPVKSCFRKMDEEQIKYSKKHPYIPIAFCDFKGTEECERKTGTLHLWKNKEGESE